MRSAAYIDNGCHGEDLILRTRHLVAVMDGVSDSDGARAAKTVVDALKHLSPKAAILDAHEQLKGTGALTTVAVADFSEQKVYTIGDSPVYHYLQKLELLMPLDRGDEPNVITQAVGSGEILLHEVKIPKEGFLLLMSDGVSDNIAPERLAECCCGTASPQTIVRRIVRLLERKKRREQGYEYDDFKDDDQALIVVRL